MLPGLPHRVAAGVRSKHPERRQKTRWRLWLLTTEPQKAEASFLTALLTEAATGAHPVSKGGDEAPPSVRGRLQGSGSTWGIENIGLATLKIILCICLFLACAGSLLLLGFSPAAASGAALVAVRGLLTAVVPLLQSAGSRTLVLSSCGFRDLEHRLSSCGT